MNEIQPLKGKVAIVTGSSRGIGAAIAVKLAEDGAKVVVNYHSSKDKAEEVVGKIKEKGGEALAIKADVSSSSEVNAMVRETVERFDTVHILVNNAAYYKPTPISQLSDEEWNLVIHTNLSGAFFCARAVWDIMKNQRYGRIINISSMLGVNGEMSLAHYISTKAGLMGLTKALAWEGERYNIIVNTVLPGLTKTEGVWDALPEAGRAKYMKYDRLCMPEDIAETVAFLVSERANKIRGHHIPCDGGQRG